MKDYLNYKGDLKNLSRHDLEELFLSLYNYKLKYRASLGIDERESFGCEIEFEEVLLYFVRKELSKHENLADYQVHPDDSCGFRLDEFDVGGELVSPILHDTKANWQNLEEALKILKGLKAKITNHTSLHVHVGSQIFGEDIKLLIRFIKVWCIFVHIIFRFAYGSTATEREYLLVFSHPISEAIKLMDKKVASYLESIRKPSSITFDKKWAVNLANYTSLTSTEEPNNMIEIRCANGTLDKSMIQNTINVYLKIMLYVTSDAYDEALINRLFQRLKPKHFDTYKEIYIKDALLLADLIFDNSLDKINFLKQYVKKDCPVLKR